MDSEVIVVAASLATFAVAGIAAYLAWRTEKVINKTLSVVNLLLTSNMTLGRTFFGDAFLNNFMSLIGQSYRLNPPIEPGDVQEIMLDDKGHYILKFTEQGLKKYGQKKVETKIEEASKETQVKSNSL